ncbi:hypothetical protein EV360DRAFT_72621 [Lentinula raphanica]|nr:hypothetical protein EV360DRAFT_72621 [Lentinula raphanica]
MATSTDHTETLILRRKQQDMYMMRYLVLSLIPVLGCCLVSYPDRITMTILNQSREDYLREGGNCDGLLRTENWNHYVELMEFVILVYDFVLTLDMEIERFWKRDTKRLASVLFFVNRYLTLVGNIPLIREAINYYGQILIFLVQWNISVLFVLRMKAIYSGSRRITGFLCVALVAMAVNDVVQLHYADLTPPNAVDPPSAVPQVGAIPTFSNSQWTYYIYRDGYGSGGIGTIIMRDGLMYFGIITLATLANIIAFLIHSFSVEGCDLVRNINNTNNNIYSLAGVHEGLVPNFHQHCLQHHDVAPDDELTGGP